MNTFNFNARAVTSPLLKLASALVTSCGLPLLAKVIPNRQLRIFWQLIPPFLDFFVLNFQVSLCTFTKSKSLLSEYIAHYPLFY